MFPGLQQKEISGFLTFLWHQDNSKAMWTVLAKAYSIIRDSVGKENAPLELFLAVNAPFIGIIGPQDYLIVLGYELTTKKNGELALTPLDGMESISRSSNGYFPTSMSVDDIVCNSVACGYVDGHQLHLTMPGDQAVLTMAIPAPAPAQAQPNQDVPAETCKFGPMPRNTRRSYKTYITTDTDEEFMNDLSKELARIDSEMRVIAEVADATEGVVDLHEEPVAAPDLNMSPPSPHGWNLDSFTYDPFQGDPFNAFDLGVGTNEFDDSEFSALLDDYFL